MVSKQEIMLHDFFKNLVANEIELNGFKVFRGYLPNSKIDFTKGPNPEEEFFPYLILRVLNYEHIRTGIDTYDSNCDFELWVGAKIQEPEEYMELVKKTEKIEEKLLEKTTDNKGFIVDQTKPFKMQWFKDQTMPYMYALISFSTKGNVILSKIKETALKHFDEIPKKQ